MVHTPARYVAMEQHQGYDVQKGEVVESRSSPLRVHFLDYKDEELEGRDSGVSGMKDEQVSRMTFDDHHQQQNKNLSIVPPPAPRLAKDLYLQFSNHLDKFDRDWRDDPFWRDVYPRWAEPIFKDGLDVRTNIYNDRNRFAVEIDAYQFRPEELEVKTLDDTLLIEGRHEDVRDRDNYTKMYFVRKYQLPPDVHPQDVSSSIDSSGRLTVEARKPYAAIDGRERVIPIEGSSNFKRSGSRSNIYTRDANRSPFRNGGTYDNNGFYRSESRAGNDYRNGNDSRFRSEFSTSNNNLNTTTIPVTTTRESYSRSASRSSRREFSDGPDGFYQTEVRSSSRGPGEFRRSASRGPDFRSDFRDEHLLRPEPEIGNERSASRASSSRFERREVRYT